jgi:alkylhydroperoxidase family enzyme
MPTNLERAFEDRPDVYTAWRGLITAIRGTIGARRYEIATLAAAQRLRSSYCSLAHATVLRDELGEDVLRLLHDRPSLDPVDVAVMELAEKIVDDATSVTADDLQRLRDLGFGDGEIMDVVLSVTARCFFSKTLDALQVLPDAHYRELEPELREALVVGRPIAET